MIKRSGVNGMCKHSYVCTDQLPTLESLVRKESLAGRSPSPTHDSNKVIDMTLWSIVVYCAGQ